jgi:Acetyltransferase (GNAT) domain
MVTQEIKPQAVDDTLVDATPDTSQAKYVVRILEPDQFPAWDALVSESKQGTVFHTTRWLGTTGSPFRIFGCYHHDSLVGGMAVELVGRRAAGHSHFNASALESSATGNSDGSLISHNRNCPYLGVVLPPPSKKYVTTLTQHRNITYALAKHVRDQFVSVESGMSPGVVDVQPFISAGYAIGLRYTYCFDLSDLDAVWKNMTDKRRNDIRKAERDGITVDDKASIDEVVSVVTGTFKRQGRVIRFDDVLARRDEVLRRYNQCRCFVARDRAGEPVAGVYMVWDSKCAYYEFGGYGLSMLHRGGGALALWEAIRYAGGKAGVGKFDLLAAGMTTAERFMRDFGGTLTLAFSVEYHQPSLARDAKRALRRIGRMLARH